MYSDLDRPVEDARIIDTTQLRDPRQIHLRHGASCADKPGPTCATKEHRRRLKEKMGGESENAPKSSKISQTQKG